MRTVVDEPAVHHVTATLAHLPGPGLVDENTLKASVTDPMTSSDSKQVTVLGTLVHSDADPVAM